MSTAEIIPCIWLDDKASQAAEFYINLFPDSRIIARSCYPHSFDNPGNKPRGSILTVEIEIAGRRFTLLNGDPLFVLNTSISWQIITGRREQETEVIAPCLMFQEANKGKTEEAMRFYTDCFANGRIEHIEHYLGGEGPTGYVKHGRFTLGRQTMFAMDSPFDYGFNFNEAISLQVMCSNQKELDSYWEALADGGEHSQCGWLKDRFGISWQVVPAALITWMQNTDSNAWDRAFEAMMSMQKLDIETLESLFSF